MNVMNLNLRLDFCVKLMFHNNFPRNNAFQHIFSITVETLQSSFLIQHYFDNDLGADLRLEAGLDWKLVVKYGGYILLGPE